MINTRDLVMDILAAGAYPHTAMPLAYVRKADNLSA